MELNRTAPTFLTSEMILEITDIMKKNFTYGYIFAIMLLIILKLVQFLPFLSKLNITNKFFGYERNNCYNELVKKIDNKVTLVAELTIKPHKATPKTFYIYRISY